MSGITAGEKSSGIELRGLIVAAGNSSRMGDFKPLMEINGFPMITMTVQSMRNAGIREITVVIGRNANEMRGILTPLGVHLVENPDYRKTDMLHSVQLGLKTMTEAEGICFLPGDMPLISPLVLKKIKDRILGMKKSSQVLIPMLGEKQAHPPVFFPGAYTPILTWKGEGGMRRVFEFLEREYVSLDDPGILMDADVQADIASMRKHAKATRGISGKLCAELYREMYLPENIRRHCIAVGNLAGKMAERLIENGACLDVELCRSGGYVHDICRLLPCHEKRAGEFLEQKGYLALAEIAKAHGGFTEMPRSICQERVIVCLADKLVQETKRVTLWQRYQKAFRNPVVKPSIKKSYYICCRLVKEYEERTGEKLYAADLSE